ncbi:hypothetical protein ONR75_11125 [Rhodopseudomonas sp. P2A-2r]|uniref:hypothetical protein n=1 Tax=Rhodopseudomonas sp. P2A-2r TaxID=2991972 RepID=UPI0022340060|nr:hypothetical protein [Rhodopseudomonas sp. P2A-2r]UZE51109.1 hypothetical protein ONR75_11125 [Rhodopseudomonas sp. P2A-2r]
MPRVVTNRLPRHPPLDAGAPSRADWLSAAKTRNALIERRKAVIRCAYRVRCDRFRRARFGMLHLMAPDRELMHGAFLRKANDDDITIDSNGDHAHVNKIAGFDISHRDTSKWLARYWQRRAAL